MGAGEAALAMTEELAFHQLGRNRSAIDRHKRRGRTRAELVDQARDQFLADAGFTGNVNRGLAAGYLGDGGAQFLHGLGIADQLGAGGILAGLLFLGQSQCSLHEATQHGDIDGFGDEVEGTGLERHHRRIHVAVGGDHGDRRFRVLGGNQLDDFMPGAVGKAHVGEAQGVAGFRKTLFRFADGRRGFHHQAHATEGQGQQLADIPLVIDDQCELFAHALPEPTQG